MAVAGALAIGGLYTTGTLGGGGTTTGGTMTTGATTTTGEATTVTKGRSVTLINRPFVCSNYPKPLNIEVLRVRQDLGVSDDAVSFTNRGGSDRGDCYGHIGKIEVITGSEDGIKVGEAVTDITIDEAWIFCYDIEPAAHQDAFQATGGHDLSIKLISRCRTSNHSSFFVNAGVGPNPPPRDIVCHDCELKGGSTTVHTTERRSGVIDSDIYCGNFFCFEASASRASSPRGTRRSPTGSGSSRSAPTGSTTTPTARPIGEGPARSLSASRVPATAAASLPSTNLKAGSRWPPRARHRGRARGMSLGPRSPAGGSPPTSGAA